MRPRDIARKCVYCGNRLYNGHVQPRGPKQKLCCRKQECQAKAMDEA